MPRGVLFTAQIFCRIKKLQMKERRKIKSIKKKKVKKERWSGVEEYKMKIEVRDKKSKRLKMKENEDKKRR